MKKSVWAVLILLLVAVGILGTCLVSKPFQIALGNGIKAVGTSIVAWFRGFTHMLLTHPYAPIFFWIIMPATGGIIVLMAMSYGVVRPILARLRRQKAVTEMPPPITTPKTVVVKEEPVPLRTSTPPNPAPEPEPEVKAEPEAAPA